MTTEMSPTRLKDKISMRWLVFSRYFFQTLLILGFLTAIFIFRHFGFISNEVVGTLLGTTIGTLFKVAYRSNNETEKTTKGEEGK